MIISVTDRKFLSKGEFTMNKMRINDKLKKVKEDKFNLKFDLDDSMVSGNDGCNNMSGKVVINGNKIKLGPFMTTRMYCEKVVTDKHFYKLINETDEFKVNGDKLKLYGGKKLLIELVNIN